MVNDGSIERVTEEAHSDPTTLDEKLIDHTEAEVAVQERTVVCAPGLALETSLDLLVPQIYSLLMTIVPVH